MGSITRFKKIPLKGLIDALIALYDGGADYVDIMGETGEIQDEIGLAIKEEYMASEEDLEFEDEDYDNEELNEEGLNELI